MRKAALTILQIRYIIQLDGCVAAEEGLLQASRRDQESARTDLAEGQAHQPAGGGGEDAEGTARHGGEFLLMSSPPCSFW